MHSNSLLVIISLIHLLDLVLPEKSSGFAGLQLCNLDLALPVLLDCMQICSHYLLLHEREGLGLVLVLRGSGSVDLIGFLGLLDLDAGLPDVVIFLVQVRFVVVKLAFKLLLLLGCLSQVLLQNVELLDNFTTVKLEL